MRFVIHPQHPDEPVPVLGHFPFAAGSSEPMSQYRHEHQRRMRLYVIYWLGELDDYETVQEQNALLLCHTITTGQLFRALHPNEAELLWEAVRDVLAARETMHERADWLADQQAAHVGEVAS
jgi:hypothetical protein